MLILISFILVCLLGMIILLIIWSPGTMDSFVDNEGNTIESSISEKVQIDINGIKQGMFIKGKNINNPVLLFVHGGPGMPEYFLGEKYTHELEEDFTICWWEQPGVGLSYSSNIKNEDLTVDSIVDDTIEVANYLRKRFNNEKIYLLGHSWGSFIGIQAAYKRPELFNAYIGVGQITNQKESEKLAYNYMLDKYNDLGNSRMVRKLEEYKVNESDEELLRFFKSLLRDSAMHTLGIGTAHKMNSVITEIFIPLMKTKDYTIIEKMNIWRGKAYLRNNTSLVNECFNADITSKIEELKIPSYFFSGEYDYTVSYKLTQYYCNKLKAPKKRFYLFDNCAHSPIFEEPDMFYNIMLKDIVK